MEQETGSRKQETGLTEAGTTAAERLKTLSAVAFDVDGVLTDGRLTWSPSGEEFKSFSFTDIMGVSLLRRLGLKMALISGEATPQVDLFAKKMHIPFVAKGTRDKATALREFAEKFGVPLEQTCFFGDDVNDLFAMEIAGMCACPANAAGRGDSLCERTGECGEWVRVCEGWRCGGGAVVCGCFAGGKRDARAGCVSDEGAVGGVRAGLVQLRA